ncbi:hypothetical protein HUJ04_007122 [Dendroctonus ponderosae]|nr:hypothetical protein HUJ04_007122 [Dendroctonus ponderosae]
MSKSSSYRNKYRPSKEFNNRRVYEMDELGLTIMIKKRGVIAAARSLPLQRDIDDPAKICAYVHIRKEGNEDPPSVPIFGKDIKVNQNFGDNQPGPSGESRASVEKSRSRSKHRDNRYRSRTKERSLSRGRSRSREKPRRTNRVVVGIEVEEEGQDIDQIPQEGDMFRRDDRDLENIVRGILTYGRGNQESPEAEVLGVLERLEKTPEAKVLETHIEESPEPEAEVLGILSEMSKAAQKVIPEGYAQFHAMQPYRSRVPMVPMYPPHMMMPRMPLMPSAMPFRQRWPVYNSGAAGLKKTIPSTDTTKKQDPKGAIEQVSDQQDISSSRQDNSVDNTTGIIGKKHVGPDNVYPFDYSQTEENNSILQVGRNITHIKLLAREFLNSSGDKPFFLYIAFHDPHRCGHTNPQYGEFCQRFGNGEEGMGLIPDWHPITYQWDEIVPPFYVPDTEAARKDIAAQYTTMGRLDEGVGLILKELENAGYSDNTLVMFSSDNGIPFPNGRTNLYDSGLAEPMFLSSPFHKERKNQVTNSLASLLDIVPTLLDWYGISENDTTNWESNEIQAKRAFSGKSLLPLLIKEPDDKSNEAIFASHNLHEVTMCYPMRMIRTQGYKLIHNLNYNSPFPIDQDFYISSTFRDLLNRTKSGQPTYWFKTLKSYYNRPEWELYDMKMDPAEVNNLASKPSVSEIFRQLKKRLFEWQQNTNDPWICAPHAVLEDQGAYKNNPTCLDLDNFS